MVVVITKVFITSIQVDKVSLGMSPLQLGL